MQNKSALIGAAVSMITCLALSGCSSATSATCKDFADKDSNDQLLLAMDLIKAHDLDPTSNAVATAKITNTIQNYCGLDPTVLLTGGKATATQHVDDKIDDAIDWASYK